jgi:hypothetical protein
MKRLDCADLDPSPEFSSKGASSSTFGHDSCNVSLVFNGSVEGTQMLIEERTSLGNVLKSIYANR